MKSLERCLSGALKLPPNLVRFSLEGNVKWGNYTLSAQYIVTMLASLPRHISEIVISMAAPVFDSAQQRMICEQGWTRIIWSDDEWIISGGEQIASLREQLAARCYLEINQSDAHLEHLSQFARKYETMTNTSTLELCTPLIGEVLKANPTAVVPMTRDIMPSQFNWSEIREFSSDKILAWINHLAIDDDAEESCMLARLLVHYVFTYSEAQAFLVLVSAAKRQRPRTLRRICQLLWLMSFNRRDKEVDASTRDCSVSYSFFVLDCGENVIKLLNEHYHDQIASVASLGSDVPFVIWSLQEKLFPALVRNVKPHLMASALYMIDNPEWAIAASQGARRSVWFDAHPSWRTVRIICDTLKSKGVTFRPEHVVSSRYETGVLRLRAPLLESRGCSFVTSPEPALVCTAPEQRRWEILTHTSLQSLIFRIEAIVSAMLSYL